MLGYFLGQIDVIKNNIELAAIAIVAISLIPVGIEYLRHRRAACRGRVTRLTRPCTEPMWRLSRRTCMAHVNTAHRGVRIAAALAAVIIGATACGSDNKSSSAITPLNHTKTAGTETGAIGGDAAQVPSPAATTPAAAEASPPGQAPATATPGGAPTGAPTEIDLPAVAPQNKFLAIDVSYGIEVDDMTKGINDVVALSDRHGGQIYERNINITDDRSSTASFVIKLPPENIEAAIAELDSIGIRRTASQGTEDVTGQAVDIDARLVTAQASLDRVRKLLESATDLGQVLSLESQLTERETLVEQYTAMKRALDDRVSLATLRVQLSLSPSATTTTVVPALKSKPTIGKAFENGWQGFVNVLAAILIFIGYTAPFLVIVAIGAALLIPITRRRRRQQAQRSRSIAPPPPPAPDADQRTSERDSVGAASNP